MRAPLGSTATVKTLRALILKRVTFSQSNPNFRTSIPVYRFNSIISFLNSTMAVPNTYAYPGVNLPLRFLRQNGKPGVDFYRLGSSDGLGNSTSEMLHVREVAMMILMDRLTDKPGWHDKVFNDDIVDKWRQEALSQDETALYQQILCGKDIPMPERTRIVSEQAFNYVR
jgi:hypothetical protein